MKITEKNYQSFMDLINELQFTIDSEWRKTNKYEFESLEDHIDKDDLLNADDAIEYIRELDGVCDIEIIYYTKAMQYLLENDPSLQKSLSLANDYWYSSIDRINSELLASLLASENAINELNTFLDILETYFVNDSENA